MHMPLPRLLTRLLKDPPPVYVFELSEAGMAVARTAQPPQIRFHALEPDVLSVSPVKDNVLRLEALTGQVQAAAPRGEARKRPGVAVIIPDGAVRISVLDFDAFPSEQEQQRSLVRFRIKKSLPFDVDSASLSYIPQNGLGKKHDVVVAVSPLEVVSRYEAPFRAAGFQPGLVTTSTLAALHLAPRDGLSMLVKVTGRILTISLIERGALRLFRSLELSEGSGTEMLGHLYPTIAYTEDQFGKRPDRMLICGFGATSAEAAIGFETELGVPVEPLRSRLGVPDQYNSGLLGCLESIEEL